MMRRAFSLLPMWVTDKLFEAIDGRFKAEFIGQEECPLMVRWTIFKFPFGLGKLMVHRFPPNVTDRDPHDHPSPFITLILAGGYFNTEWEKYGPNKVVPTIEWLGRGELRYRLANHMHITETDERGAWTVVLMGPKTREWGFLKDGVWMQFERYIEQFGGVIRCDPTAPGPSFRSPAEYKTFPPEGR